jgi:formylmethanofuran dehydrogenase subunit D
MQKLKVTLLTGRTVEQGTGKEKGKTSQEYQESVAICEIDPEDMKTLNIKENSNIKITTEFGSTVLKAKKSKRGPHPSIVFVPYGPWASYLMGAHTHGTGMPSFKGIPAEIEIASPTEHVLSITQLLKQSFKKE